MRKLSIVLALVFTIAPVARAQAALTQLAGMTSPCAAAALDAAAEYAKKNAGGDASLQFSSFGPTSLSEKAAKAGANESFWIGFQNSAGRQLNLKVAIYCQQGGWQSVVSIERQ